MKIEGRVFIGADVYIDDEMPYNVVIRRDSVIGIRTIILAHFHGAGRVEIGPEAFIGPNSVIMPNVVIGEGAVVAAGSVVYRDVPPYTLVGGVPEAKPIARVTQTLGIGKSRDMFQRGLRPLRSHPGARAGVPGEPPPLTAPPDRGGEAADPR